MYMFIITKYLAARKLLLQFAVGTNYGFHQTNLIVALHSITYIKLFNVQIHLKIEIHSEMYFIASHSSFMRDTKMVNSFSQSFVIF